MYRKGKDIRKKTSGKKLLPAFVFVPSVGEVSNS
jgi:hypothetical protein